MRSIFRLIFLCLAVPVLAAATVLPEWQESLNGQMQKDYGCEVNGYSNLKLGIKDGKEAVSARVHCTDKRTFDVSRVGRGEPFKVEECGPAAC